MRRVSLLLVVAGLGLSVCGCGPAVSKEELGDVVYEAPLSPDAKPYVLPESHAKPPKDMGPL